MSAGYQWISEGGFCFGINFEASQGTISLRNHENGLLVGISYSFGGVL
ncbi:hypothetical protein [Vulgatibacter incomptus]|nr:hypothetical protein [Vulgatibacter incomptus]